jgi:hypothetical protein
LPEAAGKALNVYLNDMALVEEATYENKPLLIYFSVQIKETDRRKVPEHMFQAVSNCMAMGILYFEGRKAGWEEGLLLKFFHVLMVDITSVNPEDNPHINYANAPGLLVASASGEVVEFLTAKRAVEAGALLEALLKGLRKSGIDGQELIRRGVRDIPRIQALEDRRFEIEKSITELHGKLAAKKDRQSENAAASAKQIQSELDEYASNLAVIRRKLTRAYDNIMEVPLLYSMLSSLNDS